MYDINDLINRGYYLTKAQGVPVLKAVHPELPKVEITLSGGVARVSYGAGEACQFRVSVAELVGLTVEQVKKRIVSHATGGAM